MELIPVVLILGALLLWFYAQKRRVMHGTFTGRTLNYSYEYSLGDNVFDSAKGHGIQIQLPKKLPEIFIDSHNDGKKELPIDYVESGQKVTLEGDFNTYFQVFCAPNANVETLSILTPDVMAVLVDSSEKFDVHIVGSTLQIFANGRVFRHAETQSVLLSVAQKLIVEIDHKIRTWQGGAEGVKLLKTQEGEVSVKLGKKYVRSSTITLAFITSIGALFCYIPAIIIAVQGTNIQAATFLFTAGFMFFPVLWLILSVIQAKGLLREDSYSQRTRYNVEKIGAAIRLIVIISFVLITLYAFAQQN